MVDDEGGGALGGRGVPSHLVAAMTPVTAAGESG